MTDVIEVELVEETPIDVNVDFEGEFVSGTTGEEYEKGYNKGFADGELQGEETGYIKAQQAEYDRFWDIVQENGNRIKYQYCFAGKGWTDELFKPKYPIVLNAAESTGYTVATFMHTGITNINVPITVTENTSLQSMCHSATELETICLLKVGGNNKFTYAFLLCSKLKNITIEGPVNLDIDFQHSPLTVDSMKSVINALTDYSGTENANVYAVKFTNACWNALEASGSAPDGGSWADYVINLGWLI